MKCEESFVFLDGNEDALIKNHFAIMPFLCLILLKGKEHIYVALSVTNSFTFKCIKQHMHRKNTLIKHDHCLRQDY